VSRPAAVELLAALAGVMERSATRWYLCGAQAVCVHGRPRMTADIDVTVESYDPLRLMRDLVKAGFRPSIRGIKDVLDAASVVPLIHEDTKLPVDVAIAGNGIERDFLSRAKPTDVGGVTVPVIAAGDLIVAKLIAGRQKDIEDVQGILVGIRAPELARTVKLIAAVDAALERKDLTATLDKLVAEVRGQRPAPRRRAK
jgi:hypothetical protein